MQCETSTEKYLELLGVPELAPALVAFDPGYDLNTLEGHLEQSSHLLHALKISMSCWMIANEEVVRKKIAVSRNYGVLTVAGGGPFEIAVSKGRLREYLELCASLGLGRIEAGEGFIDNGLCANEVVSLAKDYGLAVQYELGKKFDGGYSFANVDNLIRTGQDWLDAGAEQIVIEARENAAAIGLFDKQGALDITLADEIVRGLGGNLHFLQFEAPTKSSQFQLLEHFGQSVILSNVRLEEILRVEIYRRGLHSQSFHNQILGLSA